MVKCGITYCDEPAVKAVQNGGVRIHVCNNHGDVYEPIPPADAGPGDGCVSEKMGNAAAYTVGGDA